MLLVLWMAANLIVHSPPRAVAQRFQARLQNHEVTECVVKDDAIEGKIERNLNISRKSRPHG
jgi:hypothetical protein